MDSDTVLKKLSALLANTNFASFEEMESLTGATRDELIFLKTDLEKMLRSNEGDSSLSITSAIHFHPPGFFIEN